MINYKGLEQLFINIDKLPYILKARVSAYNRLNCYIIRDLLYHLPVSINDRTRMPSLDSYIINGEIITATVKVYEHHPPSKRGGIYKISCGNETGSIEVAYFNSKPELLKKMYPIGAELAISGKIEKKPYLQMIHPDMVVAAKEVAKINILEPVYPLTYALTNRQLRRTIAEALKNVPQTNEWLQESLLIKYSWPSWHSALFKIHNPQNINDISLRSKFRMRLAFDEILAHQLSLYAARNQVKSQHKQPMENAGILEEKFLKLLPFKLTPSQQQAIAEIKKDQQKPERMLRLLQGDVGSGKTMVAFIAMLNAIESGKQAAIIAPTDILARQHYQNLQSYCQQLGITTSLLTAKQKPKEKKEVLTALASGESKLVIGTHALFQESVIFMELGIVIIDEQHRFGVEQRLSLAQKGNQSDVLMMTATPIPRTLAMVNYGDMDITIMQGKPAKRQPIKTSLVSTDRVEEIIDSLGKIIASGEKVFWICPLVEESEKLKLTDVQQRWESINKIYPDQVAVVHGKMPAKLREEVMQNFADSNSNIKILVATTVIEVGVDIPDATVIIIEHAERFGLSQLHQLRGRVGRNDKKAYCILLYQKPLGEISTKRLQTIKESNDGFYLAEQDLLLRGAGDLLGTKQSGLPEFKAFVAEVHQDLLELAQSYVQEITLDDPKLNKGANVNLRLLMQLFEYQRMLEFFGS
jgi:ATP-dependent DNA helicase RecG